MAYKYEEIEFTEIQAMDNDEIREELESLADTAAAAARDFVRRRAELEEAISSREAEECRKSTKK